MKEIRLRKWHRTIGIILALFIVIQVLTGIVLSVENLLGVYWGGFIHDLHEDYGKIGGVYRLALGFGILVMVATGSIISLKIRQRQKNKDSS